MSKRTEIVVQNRISLSEHRFMTGEAEVLLETQQEHRLFGLTSEHRSMGTISEHLVLDQATLRLRNPHIVSSVTLQRRSDGSFFLIIEE